MPAEYITKLPKAEHDAPEWQAAMEALLLVADLAARRMFARIGVVRARRTWTGRRSSGSGLGGQAEIVGYALGRTNAGMSDQMSQF